MRCMYKKYEINLTHNRIKQKLQNIKKMNEWPNNPIGESAFGIKTIYLAHTSGKFGRV